ncbi:putative thioesterase [Halovivax ruber XH-70]|uniref:Putative thioesterase n=1 Tax=Halovivax ruber (strain DSM 18193 / JCM 13892 / XH-70) TaxID=797302 RepID=L0IAH7_HALRX|nr:thioesterase family protein [Halovivax ruber]AGB16600.1 putative thioesterase [Halovivax ruber XH-70]
MSDSSETSVEIPYDGSDDTFETVSENRVRLAETDLGGVVFYGEYVTYQDAAVAAYRRQLGYGGEYVREPDLTTRVVATELEYYASARFEDVLENEVRVSRIGRTSVTYDHRIRRKADGELLAEGTVTQVVVDAETAESAPVPAEMRQAIVDRQSS